MNHIISTHYNVAYGCGICLKEVFLSGQQLKTHIKVCMGFPKDNTPSSSDWEPLPPGTQDSPHCISPCSKEAKSGSAKGPSSHKDHRKSHKNSKEWDGTPVKDKQDEDQPKSKKSCKK